MGGFRKQTLQPIISLGTLIGTFAYVASIVFYTKLIYGQSAKKLENILNEMDE